MKLRFLWKMFIFLSVLQFPLSPITAHSKDTIKIASFNIQVFGKTKAKKPEVMNILAAIISNFDIVAIQEVRDKSGTAIKKLENVVDAKGVNYDYVIGPRLGRSNSKEQYAFMYRADKFEPVDSFTYEDPGDIFHREPLCVQFKLKNYDVDFVLINIHTDPDDATAEISTLPKVVMAAENKLGDKDIIILGDFNSDCTYFDETIYSTVFPADEYFWVIDNSFDTTVSHTVCTYDRIVLSNNMKDKYSGICGMVRYDLLYGLDYKMAKKVSDHYPVWVELIVDGRGWD